jgi:sugar lactone lactonase YvrE
VRIDDAGDFEEIANVAGRPLGLEWLDDGAMVVCNADLGLQRVTVGGEVTTMARGFEDEPFVFTNNATVASDGTVYFSVTSTRWSIHEYVNDLLEGQPTGRVPAKAGRLVGRSARHLALRERCRDRR